jgi:hypothetical protein
LPHLTEGGADYAAATERRKTGETTQTPAETKTEPLLKYQHPLKDNTKTTKTEILLFLNLGSSGAFVCFVS